MQDNNIDVFISDAEIEYFELSKPISDQTWDEFVRERKAISLEFSRKFNFNLVLSEPAIVSQIDSIAKDEHQGHRCPNAEECYKGQPSVPFDLHFL